MSSPVKTCTGVLLYLLCGEFCLVYSAKPSLEITIVNLLLKGGKGEVWLDSGKEQVVLFSLVAFAVPQAMRAGETGS